MKIRSLRISIQCLVIVICIRMFRTFDISEPAWFEGLSNYIQHNNDGYRQVVVLTSGNSGDPFEDHWLRRILHITMAIYPTLVLDVDSLPYDEEQIIFHEQDGTATLFIYVDDIQTYRSSLPNSIIPFVRKISFVKTIIKFLIILPSSHHTHIDNLLRDGWSEQIMDLVILEVGYCRRKMTTILKKCDDDGKLSVIHYFNPFLDLMINKTYGPGIDLFPDVMSNLHGYPLKIGVYHRPPFSYASRDEDGRYTSIYGSDISVIRTLAEKMNFTLEIVPYFRILSLSGLYIRLMDSKMDIFATLTPHFFNSRLEPSFRSETLLSDEFCALVPIERAVRFLFPKTVIAALILTIGIILVFWATTWLFRFHKSWTVFHIARVLFGIPVNANHLRFKLPQQLVIKILMIVSLFYSANIYGALTEISIDGDNVFEIENFHDLDRSGLTPIISNFMHLKTFANVHDTDQAWINLKNKAVIMDIQKCPTIAARYKNVTCLMGKREGELYIKSTYQNGEPTLKFSKTCFWSDNYAFIVNHTSPYRGRIDALLNRLTDVGLKMMWYRNRTSEKIQEADKGDYALEDIKRQAKGVLHIQLMIIILFGSGVAIIAFIVELSWFHGTRRWRRQS